MNIAANFDTAGPPTPWKTLPEVIETKRVPVMLYADRQYVETEAIQQLIKLAESPMPVSRYAVRLPRKRTCMTTLVALRIRITTPELDFEIICWETFKLASHTGLPFQHGMLLSCIHKLCSTGLLLHCLQCAS